MHLVQVLLPLYANDGSRIPSARFRRVAEDLSLRFGGLTAYTRAPARGLWRKAGEHIVHDDVVIYEVMAARLESRWWRGLRKRLESQFRQEEIVIRAQAIRKL